MQAISTGNLLWKHELWCHCNVSTSKEGSYCGSRQVLKAGLNSGGVLRPIVYTAAMPEHGNLLLVMLKLIHTSRLENWPAAPLSIAGLWLAKEKFTARVMIFAPLTSSCSGILLLFYFLPISMCQSGGWSSNRKSWIEEAKELDGNQQISYCSLNELLLCVVIPYMRLKSFCPNKATPFENYSYSKEGYAPLGDPEISCFFPGLKFVLLRICSS